MGLSDASIKQIVTGVGQSGASPENLTFPIAPVSHNLTIFVSSTNLGDTTGMPSADTTPPRATDGGSSGHFGDPPTGLMYMDYGTGAKTAWPFGSNMAGTTVDWLWLIAEISDINYDPTDFPETSVMLEGAASDHFSLSPVTSLSTNDGFATGLVSSAPGIMFATFVARSASGSPATVTGFANHFDEPGTWQRFGSTVETSTGFANIRLDMAYKIVQTAGVNVGCVATWSSAVPAACCFQNGFFHEFKTPTQPWVGPRSATQ